MLGAINGNMNRLSVDNDAYLLRIMAESESEIRFERILENMLRSINSGLRERLE